MDIINKENFKKQRLKEIIISIFIFFVLFIYIYINYFSFDRKSMFDNSLPGLWEIKTTLTRDGKASTEKIESCIDEQMIESSKAKSIQEKLNFSGLTCTSEITRSSINYGSFVASCNGEHIVDKTAILVNVNGSISSKELESKLKINYSIKNSNDPEVIIDLESNSKRISDCKK